jgi:RNA polymerase sigma-70 factor (ECF subfamily)
MADHSDAELLALLQTQPSAGMERIYDRYAALVFGLARTILGSTAEAEDLTQEVFLGLISRCGYDPVRGSFAGYLTTVTRSRAIDLLRFKRRSSRLLASADSPMGIAITDAPPTPIDDAICGESARSMQAALAALPDVQRRVLELAYFKGLTQTEIATMLDTPLGTVKTWARKGLNGLRDALKKFGD